MRTLPVVVSVLVASSVALAGSASPPPRTEPAARAAGAPQQVEPELDEEDEDSERAVLRKQGIPMPPSQERKAYLAWRKKLPRAIQRKIERHCRNMGGTFQEVCNGIGPYAIPKPPSRVALPRPRGGTPEVGMTHERWQASLSPVQRRYYDDYCEVADESHGFSELCGGTPIVLAFGNERVTYSTGGRFALVPGDAIATDWPTATTPWLARDLDGDGAITHGGELFGSSTLRTDGSVANHGFEALAELDANHDGVLDAADPAFASLLVWADRDGDRASSPGELTPLSSVVVSLSVVYQREAYCDARGNCEGERSQLRWRDASGGLQTGSAVDVYLRYR